MIPTPHHTASLPRLQRRGRIATTRLGYRFACELAWASTPSDGQQSIFSPFAF